MSPDGTPHEIHQIQPSILDVEDLAVTFQSEAGDVAAVRGISYQVRAGEVLGIVGESGSGKSVSSLAIMGLLPANARVSGSVRFRERDLVGLSDRELSDIRGRRISMIFQDPLSALTPVYTVGHQIAEAVLAHNDVTPKAAHARAIGLVHAVVPAAALIDTVNKYFIELAVNGPEAMSAAKALLRQIANVSTAEAASITAEAIAERRVSPEAQKMMKAFLKK